MKVGVLQLTIAEVRSLSILSIPTHAIDRCETLPQAQDFAVTPLAWATTSAKYSQKAAVQAFNTHTA
jgi:hypothetical protein